MHQCVGRESRTLPFSKNNKSTCAIHVLFDISTKFEIPLEVILNCANLARIRRKKEKKKFIFGSSTIFEVKFSPELYAGYSGSFKLEIWNH